MSIVALQSLRHIFVLMLRDKEFLRQSLRLIRVEYFSRVGRELGYSILFQILKSHHNTYGTLPGQLELYGEMEKFVADNPTYLAPDVIDELIALIQQAHAYTDEQIQNACSWGAQKLKEMVLERGVAEFVLQSFQAGLPVEQVMENAIANYQRSRFVDMAPPVDAFSTLTEGPIEPRVPTGARWFDILTGGGLYSRGGELIGFTGPTGQGKTIAGVDLAVNVAKRGMHASIFCYEQPVQGESAHEMTYRVVANATGVSKKNLEQLGRAGLNDGQRKMIELVENQMRKYIKIYDFTGTLPGVGFGGVDELERYLQHFASIGQPQTIVVIDWFGRLVNRVANNMRNVGTSGVTRVVVEEQISKLLVLGAKYQTNFFVLHQSDTAAKGRPHYAAPKVTDAADAKNFPDLMHVCISMSSADSETGISQFAAVKCRSAAVPSILVRRDGELHRWHMAEDYHFNAKTKTYEPGAGEWSEEELSVET